MSVLESVTTLHSTSIRLFVFRSNCVCVIYCSEIYSHMSVENHNIFVRRLYLTLLLWMSAQDFAMIPGLRKLECWNY